MYSHQDNFYITVNKICSLPTSSLTLGYIKRRKGGRDKGREEGGGGEGKGIGKERSGRGRKEERMDGRMNRRTDLYCPFIVTGLFSTVIQYIIISTSSIHFYVHRDNSEGSAERKSYCQL